MNECAWETIPQLLRDAARRFGDGEAIVDGSVRMTWVELREVVERAGRAFIAVGVGPEERVAIWAPNTWQWIVAALGALDAGACLVPINTRFKGQEAAHVLERTRASLLCTAGSFLGVDYPAMLREACGESDGERPVTGLPSLRQIVVLDDAKVIETLSWERFLEGAERVEPQQLAERAAAVRPDTPSDIMFTSGTTGEPKGVVTTHAKTLRGFEIWSEVVGLNDADRYLIVNPFFHSFGLKAGVLACLMRGATIYPEAVFDPAAVLAKISTARITVLPGPPTLYQSLLALPELPSADVSSLRLAVTGAAVVPVELVRRMKEELTLDHVVTGYGLTETTGIVSVCRFDDDIETVATTSGRAIPGVEVRIVDERGAEVPRGEPGEVVVRGFNVMLGYLDDPVATAEVIDANGWLHTGDVGVMDDRGSVRITDRIKDMIIVGGFNAYPAEIEAVVAAYPGVAQVAVVGAADERLGEAPVAFVIASRGTAASPGAALDPVELVEWARTRMANYKVPRRVILVDELPLNSSGKVMKHMLREQLRLSAEVPELDSKEMA